MKKIVLFSLFVLVILLVACSKQNMPYKSLSDTKPSSPTGNVIGTQKTLKSSSPAATSTGPSCTDTDYGNFISAVGKVYGTADDGSEYEMIDTCFRNLLYEYDCNNTKPVVTQTKCKNGCQNGYCI